MSDGLLNRLETAQDERDYYKARLAEAHASLAEGDKRYAAENARLQARLAEAERDMDQLIGERDHAQGMADKLADAIATLLGVEIGEHSNMNCPWTQALEAFEDRPTASTSGPKCERCSDTGWIQGDPIVGISDEPCGCDENWDEVTPSPTSEILSTTAKGG